jgi:hypothetical protein
MTWPDARAGARIEALVRELTDFERANVAFLAANDVPHGLLEATRTGLAKSILDATQPYRDFLQAHAIHDFDRQPQGPDFKVLLPATVVTPELRMLESRATLYRPVTKQGDPRVWFRDLPKAVQSNQIFAAVWTNGRFWILNITTIDIAAQTAKPGYVSDLLQPYIRKKAGAVETLLTMLRGISEKGFLPAPVKGATAVGRLLETELGIQINSRRDPDFRGIEIKSSRKSINRTTLFAKTPDWQASRYRSSRELLDAFGYDRDGRRKLSCTISGITVNSQGLSLRVDDRADLLEAMSGRADKTSAVRWDLETLRNTLAVKHNETFWVKAESKMVSGWEYIRFTSVQHTQKPIVTQLPALLRDGKVTVDFLIREAGDKGYLFKLLPKNLSLLFPPAASYTLSAADRITGAPPASTPVSLF